MGSDAANDYGAPGQETDAAQKSSNGYGAPAQDSSHNGLRGINPDLQDYSGSGLSSDEADPLPQYDRANLASYSYSSGENDQAGYAPAADESYDYDGGDNCNDCSTETSAYSSAEERLGDYGSGNDSLGSYEENSLEGSA